MTSTELVAAGMWVIGFGCGYLVGRRKLSYSARGFRLRCAWCNRVSVGSAGQACGRCLAEVAKDGGVAGPEDWPRE